MTARGAGTHPWVQPIVVAKTGTHETTVLVSALASVGVWSESHADSPFPAANYEHWLSGPFTKTVRRASTSQVDVLIAWAAKNKIPCSVATIDGSIALAFPPMRYEDMLKRIARLQVSGTDFVWMNKPGVRLNPDPLRRKPVTVAVNADLSTGKAAAAAAHALWAWMLPIAHSARRADTAFFDSWKDAGRPFALTFVSQEVLLRMKAAGNSAYPVVDSGLTEVAPSTTTAVAF